MVWDLYTEANRKKVQDKHIRHVGQEQGDSNRQNQENREEICSVHRELTNRLKTINPQKQFLIRPINKHQAVVLCGHHYWAFCKYGSDCVYVSLIHICEHDSYDYVHCELFVVVQSTCVSIVQSLSTVFCSICGNDCPSNFLDQKNFVSQYNCIRCDRAGGKFFKYVLHNFCCHSFVLVMSRILCV